MITFDEFKKLDLRIGKVISVENHPNADKLYVMKIDIGNEERQVVAGLKPYLKSGELLNKSVAVITNLEPVSLRGVESQAMLLAASSENTVVLIGPEKEIPIGSKIS